MCLYTKYIKNPKYLPNKKNGGCPPPCPDERLRYVPVKCGKCMECRKQKQREWITRLSEEWKAYPKDLKFVTLTISDKSFHELREYNSETENDLCKKAVRRWLERVRKKTGKSLKHWFVTELGEEKGRIHLHGFVWANAQLIFDTWKYGHIFIGNFVNEKSIFYMTKYMLKQNPIDKSFVGKVLCSAGIGGSYVKSINACNNAYKKGATKEFYRLRSGVKINLCQYYRYKIYSEEEREALWIEKQEKGFRYICGEKVYVDDEKTYNNILQFYQEKGKELYGDNPEEWDLQKQRERLKRMKKVREKMRKKLLQDKEKLKEIN